MVTQLIRTDLGVNPGGLAPDSCSYLPSVLVCYIGGDLEAHRGAAWPQVRQGSRVEPLSLPCSPGVLGS